MSKEYILAVVCIFLLCISADYYLCINLKLTSTVKTIVKSLVGYFILRFQAGILGYSIAVMKAFEGKFSYKNQLFS